MATGDPYASDAELAEYLRMDAAAQAEAAPQLTLAVNAATRWINAYTHRDFNLATTATARYYDTARDGSVLVDDIGHATITIATDTAQDGTYATTWVSGDVQATPLGAIDEGEPVTRLVAVGSNAFPPRSSRRTGLVKVTARWGWPSVPSDIKLACLIQASRLLKRRDSPEGVLGGNDFGIVRVSASDRDVAALLAPYRYVLVG